MHTETNVKHCHYFNKGENCPFEEFGCKFLHSVSKNCAYNRTCKRKLCPYRHSKEERNERNDTGDTQIDDLADEDSISLDEENTSDENAQFLTSTPKKRKIECEECINQSQCTDCIVRQVLRKTQKVHFPDGL